LAPDFVGESGGKEKPLDAADVEVTGYPVAKNFAEIVCLV
jgi:hypothetical protein